MKGTVADPDFPPCPSCDSRALGGTVLTDAEVHLDTEGRSAVDAGPHLDEWVEAWCQDCGKMLISDGEWVVDPEDGSATQPDVDDHQTLDSFE